MDLPTALSCLLGTLPLLNRFRDSIAADANLVLTIDGSYSRSPSYSLRVELPPGTRIEADTHRLLDNGHGEPLPKVATQRDGRLYDAHAFRSELDGVSVTVVEYREVREVVMARAS